MRSRCTRLRSGITLTEILISILIMGVGLISLATLFPIGMVRILDASRQSRSGLLAESVVGDLGSKDLLSKPSFALSYYGDKDPFLVDVNTAGTITLDSRLFPATAGKTDNYTGGGLPVCYDPLWRSITGYTPTVTNTSFPTFPAGSSTGTAEARFGAGVVGTVSNLRNDGNALPSAHGLQRVTNFLPFAPASVSWPATYRNPSSAVTQPATLRDLAAETFVSPDDIVMQNSEANQNILNNPNSTGTAGSVVPEFFSTGSGSEIRADWRYTWFFTGRQVDISNGTVFAGDIVICDGRPFGLDTIQMPLPGSGGSAPVASGETTIEGIFGYSQTLQLVDSNGYGYGAAAERTVLLRWPAAMVDPEVKVGGWIADVTYERVGARALTKTNAYAGGASGGPVYPFQRCHWYQVSKKGEVETIAIGGVNFRQMVVYTNSTLKSRTLLGTGGVPVYVNAALIMPSVVNVFSKTIYSR